MEQLRIRAERFRKQGRLRDEDLAEIIAEIKATDKSTQDEMNKMETSTSADENKRVMEAVSAGLLQVHGIAPNTKQHGIFRILGENCNGFNNRIGGNNKLAKALDIKEDLDIDCLLYCEHRLNFRHKDNKNDLKQMFQRELACVAVGAHNVHEAKIAGRVQEGGTGSICFGEAVGYVQKTGKDDEGLGRWSWLLLSGSNGHKTRIITAYNPCKNTSVNSGTTYQQQRRYFITKKKDLTCPRKIFQRDLIRQLKSWRESGDRIILFMDHNEHAIKGPLGRELGKKDGLDLREAILQYTGKSPGATFFRGSKPIDGIWVSGDLDISNACVMPFGYGVGDHRAFVLDLPLESVIGINPVKIVRPVGRRLNSRLAECCTAYIESLESNIRQHRLLERLHDAHTGIYSNEERARKITQIDEEGKAYMKRAEKICRKIKCCRIPFSPEAAIWIRRVQVYYSILRYHKGKTKNRGNLKRAARRCNIDNPLQIPVQEIVLRLEACKKECLFYREHGKRFRRKHLEKRKQAAKESNDEEAFARISAIIQREQQRDFWRRLNYVTGKKRTRSATTIQVEGQGGAIMERTTQESVEQGIFNEVHNKRYTLAGEAPICNGDLFQDFGYLANTPASKAVLDGTYNMPPNTDTATSELFAEIAAIRTLIPKDSVSITITPGQWKRYWQVVNEETSSSESGLHFGHYKVGRLSDIIAHYHAARVTVTLAHAIQLERWSRGLSVMLEKTLGVTLVSKLRAILLMEADFNATNKIIYGDRMMRNVCKYHLMPEETFSEKNRMADDGTLCKTLFYDISRQARVPAAIASVDASNCYDRIAHAIASLVFQAFGVPSTAIETMLGAIENMKFFLRTGFGDSQSFAGGGVSVKTQGLTQGNGASPAGWAVISICIIGAHGKKGHGAKFICPITNLQQHLSAILYVDDTDLLHIDLSQDESVNDVHRAIQDSVQSWGNLLIATGGVLQPAKCFYSIISYEWKNGEWRYADNTTRGEFGVTVPLPKGKEAPITHKRVDHAEKTLGAMTSPDGDSTASILLMQEKAQGWVNAVRGGHLHRRNIWFSLKVQFWPRVSYGLCSTTATFQDLEKALHRQYYQILPLGGVVRHTTIASRTIDSGFFGVGLPHVGVEATIAMTNKMLMHFGCQTATGRFMQISYSLFLLELGMSFQPLQLDYQKHNHLVTHTWMKMLWEKVSKFGLTVTIPPHAGGFPREGDRFIMQVILTAGYTPSEVRSINKVRVSQQVLFMSDILTAAGNKIDPEILSPRPHGEARSTMRWPIEQPTESDMNLWRNAMHAICPSRCIGRGVGRFIQKTHRIWRWRWNSDELTLHRTNEDGASEDVYVARKKPNRFHFSHRQKWRQHNSVCLVQPTIDGEHWRLASTTLMSTDTKQPSTFLEVLESWGNTWLWEHVTVTGGTEWIHLSIHDGSLVAVTDGSYIRELYPKLCSAAFVIECANGCGRIVGSFSERLKVANAYRGELLGLMAIHLMLLSVNKVHPTLTGSVEIVSDCLGAMNRVSSLPPYRIPSRCRHSDILKNILVNCGDLTFTTHYSHIKAHQDDLTPFHNLNRKAQLNCICDHAAKFRIIKDGQEEAASGQLFPLETIGVFVRGEKMTSDTGGQIRYWAHHQIARKYYHDQKILSNEQFDAIDWASVYSTLHSLPRLFQLWASKHVLGVAGTMKYLSYQDGRSPLCPSCHECDETCKHIARCPEAGRAAAFLESTTTVGEWMESTNTNSEVKALILKYLRDRGKTTCLECADSLDLAPIYRDFAAAQDVIGWDNFIMGMVSHKLLTIQSTHLHTAETSHQSTRWIAGLITQLLQVTHTQWIYRCVLVHDRNTGILISTHKAALLEEIEHQLSLGPEDLAEEDRFLLECNFDDITTTTGEAQGYWLLGIQAAREASRLRREDKEGALARPRKRKRWA